MSFEKRASKAVEFKESGRFNCTQAVLKAFEVRSGATICKDLKGKDTGVVLCSCSDCVKNAVLALGDVLD